MGLKLSNGAVGRLSANLTTVGTTVSLVPGNGAKFPALAAGDFFPLTLIRASDGAQEILKVTARSSDVLTVQRAQENTAALAFVAGDRAELRITAGTMDAFREEVVTINEATHAATSKATPSDADEIPLADSASSFGLKKLTFANLKTFLKTFFDSLYQAKGTYLSPGAITGSGLTQSTARLLGRTTAGAGSVEEITVGGSLTLSGKVLSVTVPVTSVGGYTGAVSAAQLLTAVKTVDGASSGLDADMLDGQHASAFAAASHTHSTFVSTDQNYSAIGSFCFVYCRVAVSQGSTTAGSNMSVASVGSMGVNTIPATLSGTWRALGRIAENTCSLAQRIA